MGQNAAPLIIGLVAGGLLLLIGVVPALRHPVERFRRIRRSRSPEYAAEGEEWIYRPRAPGDETTKPALPAAVPDATVGEPDPGRPGPTAANDDVEPEAAVLAAAAAERQLEAFQRENAAEAARIIDEARRQVRELLDDAGLEAQRIVVAAGQERARSRSELEQERRALEKRGKELDSLVTVQEAEHRAEELLADAERECASLVRKAEAEAERRAAEITEDAQRRAREQLERAELESRAIVVDTGRERARILSELEHERSLLEQERMKLEETTPLQEAAQTAEGLLADAERRREELMRESEAEAERRAAEITDNARRQAEDLLGKAELEAARIVDTARQERARLLKELERERSVFEERRMSLSGFLNRALEEVDAPSADDRAANVRELDDELRIRASAGSDQ
jgi:cell division septum initiation protein DivIVA